MLVDLPGVSGVDAARERELLKEALHSRHVFTLVGVDLGVCPLKVGLRQDSRSSMSGAGDEDRVRVVLVDHRLKGKLWPASEPQWPSSPGFVSSNFSGSFSNGLSFRYNIPKER